MRPLRLGLALAGPTSAAHWPGALALAETADALGLDSLWLPEGHFRPGATASPLLGLAAFAARTRQIRLGTTSLLISVHDPRRVAADVATLDQLSGGRVLLGVGRGFERGLFRAFGVDPRTKRDRFDAALDAILAAWRGTDPDAAPDLPLPAQRPHPPIVVAAFGPKGLAQAARRGLPYLASPMEDLATLADNYARHRSGLPDDVETDTLEVPVMRTVHVAADAAEARRVREAIETEFSRIAALRGRALARVAQGDASDRILVGEAAEVAEGIARYREALGMDLLVVRPAPGAHGDERRASLERLAEAVSGVA